MNLRAYVKLLPDHSGMYELTQCHPTFLLLVVDTLHGSWWFRRERLGGQGTNQPHGILWGKMNFTWELITQGATPLHWCGHRWDIFLRRRAPVFYTAASNSEEILVSGACRMLWKGSERKELILPSVCAISGHWTLPTAENVLQWEVIYVADTGVQFLRFYQTESTEKPEIINLPKMTYWPFRLVFLWSRH